MAQKVGLVGYSCSTGLGNTNLDFWNNLSFHSWLIVPHPRLGVLVPGRKEGCVLADKFTVAEEVREWIKQLDLIFCVQKEYITGLWELAKRYGVRIVVMPMIEWFQADDPASELIDIFVAPTRACEEILKSLGYGSRTLYIPYPIDTTRFQFRKRRNATLFLHCGGWGGYKGRKGTAVIADIAVRCPDLSFIVRQQGPVLNRWSSNVQLMGPAVKPEELYGIGDVAIQPSQWEGVGLQILEAMACGIPTFVPDAAPMNEYPADRMFCIPAVPQPVLIKAKPWTSWHIDRSTLKEALYKVKGQPIEEFSMRAAGAVNERSWHALRDTYGRALSMS